MSSPTSKPLLLIAEDCDGTRQCLAELFGAHGFRVVAAANGEEALLAVKARIPDVVLTDIDMPFLDGIGLVRRLRAQPMTASLPMVVLTGTSSKRALQRARAAGCDALLLKPCAPDALVQTVRGALGAAVALHVQKTA